MELAAELFAAEFPSKLFAVELRADNLIEKSASNRSVIWAVLSI
jgi:hypothetical protein